MEEQLAFFVQFPHPGAEHVPRTDEMPWNVGHHRRKFLVAPGRYLDEGGQVGEAELVFWGEWEAPSRIERRSPRDSRFPRALHRPYWIQPRSDGSRQNTDPWVWGAQMIYSVCKQPRTTSMRRLTRGSVICFGSTIAGEFCVDTVFVVASAEPWTPSDVDGLDVDEAFKVCTAESVATNPDDAYLELALYRGATFDDPVHGMFSFVPALRADEPDPRFARPPIVLPGLVNPASRQSTRGSTVGLPTTRVQEAWEHVRAQVFDHDLMLGLHLETPPRSDGDQDLPSTGRPGC
jgi:hypothetical protein